MGSVTVVNQSSKGTMIEAYRELVEKAEWDYGHSGYSGTIAESSGVVLAKGSEPMTLLEAEALADEMLRNYDDQIEKWGPAVAIPVDDGSWLFVGCYSC